MSKNKKETTVKDLLEMFLPKLWIIILVAAIFGASMSLYSVFMKDDMYSSSADVYVFKENSDPTASDIATAGDMVGIYAKVIKGDVFFSYIKPKMGNLGYNITYDQFKNYVNISQNDESPTFTLKVTTNNADYSFDLAKCVTDGIEEFIAGNILKNSIQSSVYNTAKKAVEPNSKNTVRNSIIAFVIGAILSAVAVWVYSANDNIIRNAKRIEDTLDIPVLGVIPRHDINLADGEYAYRNNSTGGGAE